jgi:single-stranded DNA-binding protein
MLDAKNVIAISGGIVSDPEIINDKIAKFRLAVDYAGSEKGSQNNSGYFDIVYYLKEGSDFASKNASFLHNQITNGKLKKGSPVQLIGRLVQERWQQDNSNRSREVIVAESVSYAASNYAKSNDSSSNSSESSTSSDSGSSNSSVPNQF